MNGDVVVAAADTKEFAKMGWEHSCSSVPAAYLVGYAAGLRAKKEEIEYAVLDLGMQNPQHGGVLFAVAKGMIDAGLEVPCSEDVLPDEDRINGKHIDDKIEADISSMKQKLEAE
jgi:large subunit ribosomal protein L18